MARDRHLQRGPVNGAPVDFRTGVARSDRIKRGWTIASVQRTPPRSKHMNRWLGSLVVISLAALPLLGEDKLTEAAARTRNERLKVKTSVEWKNLFLRECMAELVSAIKDADLGVIAVKFDAAGGVSMNTRMTYSAKDKTVGEILDEFLKANDMTYTIISKKGDKADGGLLIRKK
jgi:hypothetical protein